VCWLIRCNTKTIRRVLFCAGLLVPGNSGYARTIDALYEVGTWPGFRQAAVSYTYDDNCANQIKIALPMFNEFGFKMTLFTATNPIGLTEPNWLALQAAAAQGHEIASHAVSHLRLNTLTMAEQTSELKDSRDAIDAHIPGAKCLTMAYPYCVPGNPLLTPQYYIAARVCQVQNQIEASTPADFYQVKAIVCGIAGALKTPDNFSAKFEAAAAAGGWCVLLIHGIDDDGGASPLESTSLRASLEYLAARTDTFWVATFVDAVRYIRERNTVSVKESSNQGASITLQVTNILNDTIYDLPVTLRRPLPAGWPAANVSQNGRIAAASVVTIDSVKYMVFDVLPDAGDVVLSKCPPAFAGLYGDWTGDGVVRMDDLSSFLRLWLVHDCNVTAGADLNNDCTVNLYELDVLSENWRYVP
jgi:peptidoglycan/xylan/chitin deacetylase (PgdA/CDA1 family)